MKQLVFLLALLPCFCYAQNEAADKQNEAVEKLSDGKLNFVSADKNFTQPAARKENSPKKLKDDNVYTGNVKFRIGRNEISADSAIMYTNEGKIACFKVKITNPESFALVGDKLFLNKDDNMGEFTSNISVTAMNGAVVGTSESLTVDFKYEIYRIVNGGITPPKKAEDH